MSSRSSRLCRQAPGRVSRDLLPALGQIPVARLTPADIEVFMRLQLDEGLSPQTVIHMRGILRRALGRAVRHGLVTRNVAQLA